jgi:hypothetical protein
MLGSRWRNYVSRQRILRAKNANNVNVRVQNVRSHNMHNMDCAVVDLLFVFFFIQVTNYKYIQWPDHKDSNYAFSLNHFL